MNEPVPTDTVDVADVDAPLTTPPPEDASGEAERPSGVARLFGNARIAWAVAVAALVLAGVAGMAWADLYGADRDRQAVRQAATDLVLRLTTFEGEDIEAWLQGAQERATGEYAQQLSALFDQDLRDALRDQQVVSRGEVDQLFVQDISGDEASAFALVTQTIVNASTPDPVQDELRMDLTMQRVDGRWLASEVAVLGPSGLVQPPPQEGTEDE